MANGLPAWILTFFAIHLRPSARTSRASYEPVVTPVTLTLSSWSTAPSGSFAHWFAPKALEPEGASSSDLTVEEVRFQNWVSFECAGCAVAIAARTIGIVSFIVSRRCLSSAPRAAARVADHDAGASPAQRLCPAVTER